jgi:hypothetical protein
VLSQALPHHSGKLRVIFYDQYAQCVGLRAPASNQPLISRGYALCEHTTKRNGCESGEQSVGGN